MPNREDEVRLRHMLDYGREAIALLERKMRHDLDGERLLQLGLIRLIEVIGEAAGRVTKDSRIQYT